MSKWTILKSVIVVASLAISGAPTMANAETTFNDVRQEAKELTDVIGEYAHDRRIALADASRATLRNIDEGISELNSRILNEWGQMNDTAKATAEAAMDDLRQRRLAVAEKLGALEQSSSDSWSDIRAGFYTAFDDLRMTWEKVQQEFDPN